ncbi:DoxX family protein [Vitiosangium sp. GDMCC 1.1324]|uniref:DoxX family protein n=1 Tax=Vitiosangium sp. (strain GDMCC 1.1324) TaxID=2138576 RepID=UPI000D3DA201|nr:DoxX family protein [Vitiosangium sp. GDMCC 1.1324]PTL80930.1 DoxX family protein [Vitiosangium sp. GDMCC 1.1324]
MATATMTILEGKLANQSALPLRATLGSTMIYHGVSKLKHEGLEQTAQFFDHVGIKPGRPWALATGVTETVAGILTFLGIGTRVAALSILVTQTMAIAKVHAKKGFDAQKGGYEFNLSLIAGALALLLGGPGTVSAHHAVRPQLGRGLWRRRRISPLGRLALLLA